MMDKYLRSLGTGIALTSLLTAGCAISFKTQRYEKNLEKGPAYINVRYGHPTGAKFGLYKPKEADGYADGKKDGLVRGKELGRYIFRNKILGYPASAEEKYLEEMPVGSVPSKTDTKDNIDTLVIID